MTKTKTFKALLTDVDGTLIPNKPDGLPSQRVMDAITAAQEKIHIGIATSRPLFFAQHIFDHVPLSGPCIVSGGSQIYDATTKKIVWERPVEHDDFWKVIDIILPHTEKILVNEGDRDGEFTRSYKPDKPLGICVNAISVELADILIDELSVIPGITPLKLTSHTPGTVTVDVVHALATKQHGVFEVAKILDIDPSEIIGIGDGYNDFPLLMACGLKVAMGNAPDDLKAIADYVAPSIDEDGLADTIEKFVLNSVESSSSL